MKRRDAVAPKSGWMWKVGVLGWAVAVWSAPSPRLGVEAPQALVTLTQPDPSQWMAIKPMAPLPRAAMESAGAPDAAEEERIERLVLEESGYFSRLPRVQDREQDPVLDSDADKD